MALEYHINERDELITLTASGDVISSEACACVDELLNDPAYNPQLPQLIDLREAQPIGSAADLSAFETFLLGKYQPNLQAAVAIVVNPDWDESACAKAFWMSCALGHAELFDGWNQACKWLIKREFSADLVEAPAQAPISAEHADAPSITDVANIERLVDSEPAPSFEALEPDEPAVTPPG